MNTVLGQGRVQRSLRAVDRAPRIRPGESPAWVELRLAPADGRRWRARAQEQGLGVDAWLGTLVEFWLVMRTPGVSASAVTEAVARAAAQPRLPPTDGLRRWVRLLAGQRAVGERPSDELPTVVLAERVVAQLPASALAETVQTAAAEADETLALRCDGVAAAHGLTLETWVLRAALTRRAV